MKRGYVLRLAGAAVIFLVGGVMGHASRSFFVKSPSREKSIPHEHWSIPHEHWGKMKLFILAGQSNMSGRGLLEEAAEQPGAYTFGNDYRWHPAMDPVDSPVGQVDPVSLDMDAGVGLAIFFAKEFLKKNPDARIGLIPCAMGGSTLDEWRRDLSDESLYGSCLKRVRAASSAGHVAGLLFMQGESDAKVEQKEGITVSRASAWAGGFTKFVDDWRHDLNQPNLPVVFGQIGTTALSQHYPNWAEVQQQQAAVNLSYCEMVVTSDLSLKDEVHFSSESQQVIGRRFAQAYLRITDDTRD